MKEYLVSLTPLSPYFFGNEKGFAFSDEDTQRYFIKGEDMPSQSTVLGALRFMLLPVKKSDWSYTEEERILNRAAVGERGFDPEDASADYGMIKKISPVFILEGGNVIVETPYDHTEGHEYYTPFANYSKDILTPDGEVKYYTEEYNSKTGVTSSLMRIDDGKIIPRSDVIIPDIRAGVNTAAVEGRFYKREYRRLAKGYSFGVYITLDCEDTPKVDVVYMGQGKSAFAVTFTEAVNELHSKISALIRDDVVYCAGDTFADPKDCADTYFAVTRTKTYRDYSARDNKVQKGSMLYNLIKAGSIFIPRDKDKFVLDLSAETLTKAGYNTLIFRREDKA